MTEQGMYWWNNKDGTNSEGSPLMKLDKTGLAITGIINATEGGTIGGFTIKKDSLVSDTLSLTPNKTGKNNIIQIGSEKGAAINPYQTTHTLFYGAVSEVTERSSTDKVYEFTLHYNDSLNGDEFILPLTDANAVVQKDGRVNIEGIASK
jgi:hypothetical protein